MTLKQALFLYSLLCSWTLFAQTTPNISGLVRSQKALEPLIGAIIFDSLHQKATMSNEYGFFTLPCSQGIHTLKITFLGCSPLYVTMNAVRDTFLYFQLEEANELKTVEIQSNHFERLSGGRQELSIVQLKAVPAIGGEKDLIKALTILPGITTGEEGSATMLVRGGSNDQNLFIVDGAQVYNTGHLFGFVSLFNSEAVKKVDLYKNAFPARFGGRLSSIVDVHCKEGNKNRLQGNLDIGLINSKATLEGPIGSKSTFLAAVRSTYLDLFTLGREKAILTPSLRELGDNSGFVGYTFGDANFKINHEWNPNHKTFLNVYVGKDWFRSAQSFTPTGSMNQKILYELTNLTSSLRSYHRFSPMLFGQWYIAYAQNLHQFRGRERLYDEKITPPPPQSSLPPSYQFTLANELNTTSHGSSQNASSGFRLDWTSPKNGMLRVGWDAMYHFYKPNEYQSVQAYFVDSVATVRAHTPSALLRATELAAYVEHERSIGKKFEIHLGLRGSYFNALNRAYAAMEPRFWMSYRLPADAGLLNGAVSKMQQYQHALVKGGELVDRVVWVPSGATAQLKPQTAWQYTLGWRKTVQKWDISLETFYKRFTHLSTFSPVLTEQNPYKNWQNNLFTQGLGGSYGLELWISGKIGAVQSSLSYTWSRSDRQFAQLNQGQPFPFLYDRRHQATWMASYEYSKRLKFTALWTLMNGKRFNLPIALVEETPFQLSYPIYGKLNEHQLPLYHRLDVSMNWEKSLSPHRRWGWNLNIYNAYFRKNVYYMYLSTEYLYDAQNRPIGQKQVMKQVALLPLLPSINFFYAF
jgi:TonB dependent receptor/TonB-dependent Receptor Plug Domain